MFMRVGCSGSRLHAKREVLLQAARRLETSRFARLCFHVRRDLLTEFLARIPFESFSGLILEQLGGVKIDGNCLAETCQCRGNLVWQRDPGFYVLIRRCH